MTQDFAPTYLDDEMQPEEETPSNAPAVSDDELLVAVQTEIEYAARDQDARESNRKTALAYFHEKLPAPPTEDEADQGFCDLISSDVPDAIEATLAEIMPAFSGYSPVEFLALGPDDEQQAEIETRAVTHVAATCGSYMAINAAVKDALLRRVGVLKVYWDRRTAVTYEPYEAPMELLPELLQPRGPDEEVELASATPDETTGLVSGDIVRRRTTGKPRIDAVPLDEFLISANTATPDIDEARFVAHQRPMTRSELVEIGFDKELVDGLPEQSHADYGSSSRQRNSGDNELRSGHESTEYVMVCESYYNIDRDGDGIAELRKIVTAGGSDGSDELLSDEAWEDSPFCSGVGYLGIYTWDGVSLYDKLKGISDGKTTLLRSAVNLSVRALKQRVGVVERDGNPDDLMSSQLGGMVRCKTPTGVFALPEVHIPPELFGVMETLDSMRRDKGGAAIDSAAQATALAGDTAHGLERMMSAAEQTNAMIAKNLCETLVKGMYRKLHRLLRQYWQDPILLPGAAGWQSTEPATWQPRQDMAITMGMSVGERGRRTAALQAIMMRQSEDLAAGQDGIIVDPDAQYQARLDLGRMAGLSYPEKYWVDPQSPEAQQAAQQKAQAADQQQQMQAQQMQMQQAAQYQLLTDLERIKAQSKEQSDSMRAELEAMKAHLTHVSDMLGHRIDLAKVEADVDEQDARIEIDRIQAIDLTRAGNG